MKKIISLLIAMCFIIPSALVISACKVETFNVGISLNSNQADYTQAYKDAKGYSSKNVTHIIGRKRAKYDYVKTLLPLQSDMVAPEGKIFAGWYLNSDCSADKYFTKDNWDNYMDNIGDGKTARLYVYWVDENQKVITFDFGNSGASFTNDYRTEKSFTENNLRIITDNLETIELPEVSDLIVPEDRYFVGWFLDSNGFTPATKQNIEELYANTAEVKLYPKWEMRKNAIVVIDINAPEGQYFTFPEQIIEEYDDSSYSNYKELSIYTFADAYEELVPVLEIIKNSDINQYGANYNFVRWEFVVWANNEPSYIEVSETNWNSFWEGDVSSAVIQIRAVWELAE